MKPGESFKPCMYFRSKEKMVTFEDEYKPPSRFPLENSCSLEDDVPM